MKKLICRLVKRLKLLWWLSSRLIDDDYFIINSWKENDGEWVISHYRLPEKEPERADKLLKTAYNSISIFISKLLILKKLNEEEKN